MKNRPLAMLITILALAVAGCGGASTASLTASPTATPPAATPVLTEAPTSTPPAGRTGPLGDGRQIHTATMLADRGVLVVGNAISPWDPTGEAERYCAEGSAAFVERLKALKIPVTVFAYGNGTHGAAYFRRDLEKALPLILKAVGL